MMEVEPSTGAWATSQGLLMLGKEADSPSARRLQLSIAPQLGVRRHACPHPCRDFCWLDLVQVLFRWPAAAMSSWVHRPAHVQKTLCFSSLLQPLAFMISSLSSGVFPEAWSIQVRQRYNWHKMSGSRIHRRYCLCLYFLREKSSCPLHLWVCLVRRLPWLNSYPARGRTAFSPWLFSRYCLDHPFWALKCSFES